jgi:hypothetical protein
MLNAAWAASFRDAIINGNYDDDLDELAALDLVKDERMSSIAQAAKVRRQRKEAMPTPSG